MKKLVVVLIVFTLVFALIGCQGSDNKENRVIIYSSLEDFRNDHVLKRLREQFPDYDIVLEYHATGNNAAKVKAEGTKIEADIIVALDYTNLNDLIEHLADLSSYDYNVYVDELVPDKKNYLPWERWSGCIVIDKNALTQKQLPIPESYEDLLNPEYKDLVVMPNPKTSGTGYFFLYNFVQSWGEAEAFEYFDSLYPNVLEFKASGSGPISALMQGEAAIGLGMTFQAVTEKNKGAAYDITYFEEGAPFGASGTAMIKGRESKKAVKDVFDFLNNTLVHEDKELFSPEIIFKNQTIKVANYPEVPYADMEGYFNTDTKTRLIDKWKY